MLIQIEEVLDRNYSYKKQELTNSCRNIKCNTKFIFVTLIGLWCLGAIAKGGIFVIGVLYYSAVDMHNRQPGQVLNNNLNG